MAQIKKKEKEQPQISTASMPDIIFMLLIFFMVCTVFEEFRGLPVVIPSTSISAKIEEGRRNITHCFIDKKERISIDDKLLSPREVLDLVYLKRSQNSHLIINMKIDESINNDVLLKVQNSLREADARRIVYATKKK